MFLQPMQSATILKSIFDFRICIPNVHILETENLVLSFLGTTDPSLYYPQVMASEKLYTKAVTTLRQSYYVQLLEPLGD